jgi:hypothetical protein
MYKIICIQNNCANKNVPYYSPEATEKVTCGGCKNTIDSAQMSKKEFDEVFDYDPFKESTIGIE